ncbi:MAG: hypothetical protein NHG36_10570, partial [Chromatiaceae bacterium]|nr:hypothetical protein [Candidatus Thioaporhodococcus sediminis]
LHDDVMRALRDNVHRGVINFDALGLLKPLLPTQFHSMEMVQKFWEAVAKASAQPAKDMAERKADNPPEPHDSDAARSGTEKSS